MNKKLLFSFLMIFNLSIVFAQFDNISIIGQFTGWSTDIPMNTTDGIVYTLTAQNIAVAGGVKFRKDNSWTVNWGGSTFPSGTAVPNGPADIPATVGTYDITFNKGNLTYTFIAVASGFDNIGVIGGFNSFVESVPLVTFDGIEYSLSDFHFSANLVKFRQDNSWAVNWGGTTFPSGIAVFNGPDIPLTAAYYNVSFNKNTLAYAFNQTPISLIGNGAQGWDTDIPMTSSAGGEEFTLTNITLVDGFVKFRANNSWSKNWGSSAFPSGTGTQNGQDIPVTAGVYDITLNRTTGAYNFVLALSLSDFDSKKISVYPNPTNNVWYFSNDVTTIQSIQIYDSIGKLIYDSNQNANSVSVDASKLRSGIYFAKVKSDNAIQTFKLVRN